MPSADFPQQICRFAAIRSDSQQRELTWQTAQGSWERSTKKLAGGRGGPGQDGGFSGLAGHGGAHTEPIPSDGTSTLTVAYSTL